MEERQRIYYWDNMKGILILLVILGHYVEKGFPHDAAWVAIYSFHMPAFIFINGYFLGRSGRNPVDRIPKVLGLYALMELLNTLLDLLRGQGLAFTFGDPEYGCWYLLFLAYAYLLACFIKGKKGPLILASALFISLVAGLDSTIISKFRFGQCIYYMPFMLAGFFWNVDALTQWLKRHRLLCACGFAAVQLCLLLGGQLFHRKIFQGIQSYEKLSLTPLAGIVQRSGAYLVSGVLVICILGLIPSGKCLLSELGRHTLVIYLVHTFLLQNFTSDLYHMVGKNAVAALVLMTLLIVSLCAAIIAAQRLLCRKS